MQRKYHSYWSTQQLQESIRFYNAHCTQRFSFTTEYHKTQGSLKFNACNKNGTFYSVTEKSTDTLYFLLLQIIYNYLRNF